MRCPEAELSDVSESTHRAFYHAYTAANAAEFHAECAPCVAGDPAVLDNVERLYKINGFPGQCATLAGAIRVCGVAPRRHHRPHHLVFCTLRPIFPTFGHNP